MKIMIHRNTCRPKRIILQLIICLAKVLYCSLAFFLSNLSYKFFVFEVLLKLPDKSSELWLRCRIGLRKSSNKFRFCNYLRYLNRGLYCLGNPYFRSSELWILWLYFRIESFWISQLSWLDSPGLTIFYPLFLLIFPFDFCDRYKDLCLFLLLSLLSF